MASNITYPDSVAVWFIEGDALILATNVDSTGVARTSSRKMWKAIDESVTDGLLVHYYAEPNKVRSIEDTPDIDNSMHSALVDYVKKCLFMDKAGLVPDPAMSQSAMTMVAMHDKKFNDAIKRHGMRKRDKTGGTRAVLPRSFT
tara:strand:- start:625 stop:1056 length:432 start_codon:yes stop_codon:yes gene_type:complete